MFRAFVRKWTCDASAGLLNNRHPQCHMTRRPEASARESGSSADTSPVLLMRRSRSDSLPKTPPNVPLMVRRQQSANALLPNAQQLLGRRRTPENRSFYARVVHTQIRRRLAETLTMATTNGKKTEHPPTHVSAIVLALIGCGCILGLVAWTVLH